MPVDFRITAALRQHSADLSAIHIAARQAAMPYLPALYAEDEVLAWFTRRLTETPDTLWVARDPARIVGYFALHGIDLDDLYVRPEMQGRGVGSMLLAKAKALSPHRLLLSTFQQNTRAQAFYVARGFREIGRTDGENQERLPDIQYEWISPA